jgi:hypothetical protein
VIAKCRIRVQPSDRRTFEYKATFVFTDYSVNPIASQYLYGNGDLAVFLEDLGAPAAAILDLLGKIARGAIEEISVTPTDEAMEVLSRRPSA